MPVSGNSHLVHIAADLGVHTRVSMQLACIRKRQPDGVTVDVGDVGDKNEDLYLDGMDIVIG